jgi:hypothetical protein
VTDDTTFQAVTANRVVDGVPVYLTAAGGWSPHLAHAHVVKDVAELLVRAQADPLKAIAPYAIDVVVTDGKIRPVGLREEIRAFGPTA